MPPGDEGRARRERRRLLAAYAIITVAAGALGVVIALVLITLFD
jgi:hypothetical protein